MKHDFLGKRKKVFKNNYIFQRRKNAFYDYIDSLYYYRHGNADEVFEEIFEELIMRIDGINAEEEQERTDLGDTDELSLENLQKFINDLKRKQKD